MLGFAAQSYFLCSPSQTIIVDNNTWNNTHIATIGLMLGSSEKDAYDILDRLDVDYVLVLAGCWGTLGVFYGSVLAWNLGFLD